MKSENLVCKIEEYLNTKNLIEKRNNRINIVEEDNKREKKGGGKQSEIL